MLKREDIEVELVSLRTKRIFTCTACFKCNEEKRCVLEDDFEEIYNKMLGADAILVGSPVYFGSATPETMALLQRAGMVARQTGFPFSRKVGGPIAIARRAGHNFTYAQLLFWFMINDFVVPGSTYWNIGLGGETDWTKKPPIHKRDISLDEEGAETVRHFAKNIAWLLKRL